MRRIGILGMSLLALSLVACEQREEGAYGEPIPSADDDAAFAAILKALETPEDRRAWRNIMTRMGAVDVLGVESDSVREAIEKEKVRAVCTSAEKYTPEVKACMYQPI